MSLLFPFKSSTSKALLSDSPTTFLPGITVLLVALKGLATHILARLNQSEVLKFKDNPPDAVSAVMDKETYEKAVAYTLVKSRFQSITDLVDAGVLLCALFSGLLPFIYSKVFSPGSFHSAWLGASFIILISLVLSLISIPFELYNQFKIEADFGFNKSSLGLWFTDKVKGLVLSLVIGLPLLAGLLSLVNRVGNTWWIWGFILLFIFQLIMLVLYPIVIMPLFNKLSPLPEGPLKERLLLLGERTGFKANTIQVMDGSKRSGHSNAFFTGFGRFRRIVLFDTLIAQLSDEELEAVLAHEIGHYRLGHIPKGLALSFLSTAFSFGLIAWLCTTSWFNPTFGFEPGVLAVSFLLVGLLASLFTFWISPLFSLLSRKHEYEADNFAKNAMGSSKPMISALRKLSSKNLSNLTPHPWYSSFYYSHPTLVERERSLS
jgi:STE24 endopeptidase